MGMTVHNISAYTVLITWETQTLALGAGETLTVPLPRWNSAEVTLYPAEKMPAESELPTGPAKRLLQSVSAELEAKAEALFLPVACTYTIEHPTEETTLTVSVAEYDLEDRFTDELEYRYCGLSADTAACTLTACKALEEKRTLRALLGWKTARETVWHGWLGLIVEYPIVLHRFRYYCRPQTIQTFLNAAQRKGNEYVRTL